MTGEGARLARRQSIDGDREGLRDFVAKAEKALRCIELGEDCQEGKASP
jgi:hypothetical protein